jgi:septal ring factor EnvC (AmiA/AmiB activator)
MSRSHTSAVFVLAVLFPLLLVPGVLVAQTDGDPLLSRQRELRELKTEMEKNRAEITRLQSKEKKLGELDARLRRDREMTARYIAELEQQERALLRDLSERQEQLDSRMGEHDHTAQLLRRRLRTYQRVQRPHAAELLLSSRSFAELFARGARLARAIQRDRADLVWLREQGEDLARETSMLESRRRGLETLQEEKLREQRNLERRSQKAREEIDGVRKERTGFEQRQEELAKAEERIQGIIARLEEQMRAGADADAGPGLAGKQGKLRWPAQGEVVGRFGFDVHPRFKTKVPNKGIDIGAAGGTPVVAIAGGIVEFVDWLSGYGRCVILNHGDGYYTLYAHCARVLVGQGAKVGEGQQIAEVGDTDSVKGTCLHFEIRHREKAVDPLEWLQ